MPKSTPHGDLLAMLNDRQRIERQARMVHATNTIVAALIGVAAIMFLAVFVGGVSGL